MSLTLLILGLLLLLGVHSLRIFADGWRSAQRERLGAARWRALYALVSALGLVLTVWGYGEARGASPLLWHPAPWTRHLLPLFTLPAFVLLVAAYVPGTRIKARLGHPMLAGVVLWAVSHLLANGSLAAVLLFGGFFAWSLAAFVSSRRRDRAAGLGHPPVPGWSRDGTALAIGLVAWWLFARYGHLWLIGAPPFG